MGTTPTHLRNYLVNCCKDGPNFDDTVNGRNSLLRPFIPGK
jgi:hypothetical protein